MKSAILNIALIASASIVSAELGNRQCFLNNVPQLKGYNCCRNTCDISYVDEDGNWGVENGNWCGVPFSCFNGRFKSKFFYLYLIQKKYFLFLKKKIKEKRNIFLI